MTEIFNSYTDPSNPGAFSGLSGFLKNNKKYAKKNVEKELLKTNIFTQHNPARRKFPRAKIIEKTYPIF
jgi:hypothetical protein